MAKTSQTNIITPKALAALRYPLPESWKKAIGILKGKGINPVRYQRQIRKGWEKRTKRIEKLASHGG